MANCKITSQSDVMSGEQIAYTYDALNRLASAQTMQIGGLLTKGQGLGEPQRISAVEGHLGTEEPKGRFQGRSREFRVTSVLRETA
jgi:YD repeat-containing protein